MMAEKRGGVDRHSREVTRHGEPSAGHRPQGKADYPTQAKTGLEWATRPACPVLSGSGSWRQRPLSFTIAVGKALQVQHQRRTLKVECSTRVRRLGRRLHGARSARGRGRSLGTADKMFAGHEKTFCGDIRLNRGFYRIGPAAKAAMESVRLSRRRLWHHAACPNYALR